MPSHLLFCLAAYALAQTKVDIGHNSHPYFLLS